jgi:hypothetical protein
MDWGVPVRELSDEIRLTREQPVGTIKRRGMAALFFSTHNSISMPAPPARNRSGTRRRQFWPSRLANRRQPRERSIYRDRWKKVGQRNIGVELFLHLVENRREAITTYSLLLGEKRVTVLPSSNRSCEHRRSHEPRAVRTVHDDFQGMKDLQRLSGLFQVNPDRFHRKPQFIRQKRPVIIISEMAVSASSLIAGLTGGAGCARAVGNAANAHENAKRQLLERMP